MADVRKEADSCVMPLGEDRTLSDLGDDFIKFLFDGNSQLLSLFSSGRSGT